MLKKTVLMTVNPQLLEGRRLSTVRAMINTLNRRANLLIAPVDGYDFECGVLHAYRPVPGGKFESVGRIKPEADLWIVYSDGYWLDCKKLGFQRRRDYFNAQVSFHKGVLESGNVGKLINSPAAEAKTLKNWFVQLDPATTQIMPTRAFSRFEDLSEFVKEQGEVVAKPNWGGGGQRVVKLSEGKSLRNFEQGLASAQDLDISDYSFQAYSPGPEKRFWFAGRFAGARIIWNRTEPWATKRFEHDRAAKYDSESGPDFASDLRAAEKLIELSGLSLGAIDFIGERINDINGCGTLFTQYVHWDLIVDARPALARYLVELVSDRCEGHVVE